MRIIAVANQKGGCGKTTTAINLSACLAFLQKRVLLIDLDPQGHATCGLGIKAEFLERTSYDLFQENLSSVSDIVVPLNDYLSIIPTHVILSRVEQEWGRTGTYSFECLTQRISQLAEPHDYVMIDCPPNIGLLTSNALAAAEEVIIPIEPSFFSLHGLAKIFETLDSIQKNRGRKFRAHALMTRFEKRTRLAREIHEEVRKYFKEQMFMTTIDENIRLREAAASGKSIVDFDRESVGFRTYMGLAIEVIERGLIWQMAGDIQEPVEAKEEDKPEAQPMAEPLTVNHVQESSPPPSQSDSALVHCSLETHGELEVGDLRPKKVLGGVLFSLLNSRASSVLIAGDFNRWVAEPLLCVDKEVGLWQKVVPIGSGTFHYKFLVDDVWQQDPYNDVTAANPHGGVDSIITIDEAAPIYENGQETKTGTG